MKKYFVCGDVHSYFDQLKNALEEAGYDKSNKNHIFVSCGDLLDRGEQTNECLTFVNSIPKTRKILIRGNHEDLLERCIASKCFTATDLHNGTLTTIMNLSGYSRDDYWFLTDEQIRNTFDKAKNSSQLNKYFSSLVDYAEVGNYIFVHGWIPTIDPNLSPLSEEKPLRNAPLEWWDTKTNPDAEDIWKCARWTNGMKAWSEGCVLSDKTIVCGHWHTSYGNTHFGDAPEEFPPITSKIKLKKAFQPFIRDGIIAVDSCVHYSGFVNVVILEI